MGPRFNGVEDQLSEAVRNIGNTKLQWGHALMAWKTGDRAATGP